MSALFIIGYLLHNHYVIFRFKSQVATIISTRLVFNMEITMKKYIITAAFLMTQVNVLYANNQGFVEPNQPEQKIKRNNTLPQNPQITSGSIITVGGDPNGCHFDSIQAAIDSVQISGNSEIRIATNKIYQENLVIDDFSVSLIGGYDDCADAGLPFGPGSEYAQVFGPIETLPVLRIIGNSERHNIEIKNMKFTGNGNSGSLGGGIIISDVNARVVIDNARINFNSAVIGGGLAVIGGNADVDLTSTLIDFNSAQVGGGGIYCAGNEASITIGKQSSVELNSAISNTLSVGGGIYVVSGCDLSLYSSSVYKNDASSDGGGIYAASGAQVTMIGYEVCAGINCIGDNINPVQLRLNEADYNSSGQGEGGAIYATGANTVVSMSEVWMEENSAINGGAISARAGANFFLQAPSMNCINRLGHFSKRCNYFDSNFASTGGAIYNKGGMVEVSGFTFENNRANFGVAIYSIDSDSYVGVTGSNFIRNGNGGEKNDLGEFLDFYLIRAADSIIELNHTTFAGNEAVNAVFGVASTPNSHLNVTNSIIYDGQSGDVLNSGPGSTFFKCIIAHESASFSGSEIFVTDPQFRDIEISDFHLNAQTSPAVDMCQDFTGNGFIDIDTDIGGFDDPSRPNQDANPDNRFDAGSDESYDNDIIFKNSFDPIESPLFTQISHQKR